MYIIIFLSGFLLMTVFHLLLIRKYKSRNTDLTKEVIRLTREIIELKKMKLKLLKSQK